MRGDCRHLHAATAPDGNTDGCAACLRTGATWDWCDVDEVFKDPLQAVGARCRRDGARFENARRFLPGRY